MVGQAPTMHFGDLGHTSRPGVAIAMHQIEGVDDELGGATAPHRRRHAIEVGNAAGAGADELGIDNRGPAGNARQRGGQAWQKSGPLVAAAACRVAPGRPP
jgi:hypothetical protein